MEAKPKVITVLPTLQGADQGADVDWLASIPETFTAREGYEAADRAVRFAERAIRDVTYQYHGTLPPPPWPAHPELQDALAKMKRIREFFNIVEEKLRGTGKEAKFPKVSTEIKTGPTLTKYGRTLFVEVGKLQGWAAHSANLDDLLKVIPRPGTLLFGLTTTTLLGFAVAAYVVSPQVRRWVGRFA